MELFVRLSGCFTWFIGGFQSLPVVVHPLFTTASAFQCVVEPWLIFPYFREFGRDKLRQNTIQMLLNTLPLFINIRVPGFWTELIRKCPRLTFNIIPIHLAPLVDSVWGCFFAISALRLRYVTKAACSFAVEMPGMVSIEDNKETFLVKNKSSREDKLVDSFWTCVRPCLEETSCPNQCQDNSSPQRELLWLYHSPLDRTPAPERCLTHRWTC